MVRLHRDLGIKAAYIYHHSASKADLGAAVAGRDLEDRTAEPVALSAETFGPIRCLQRYPDTFRRSPEDGNRHCLCSVMSAEYAALPKVVQKAHGLADANIAPVGKVPVRTGPVHPNGSAAGRAAFPGNPSLAL